MKVTIGEGVLDIGAWDGYFSFTAEKVGAGRVELLTTPSASPKGRLVQHRLVAQAFV